MLLLLLTLQLLLSTLAGCATPQPNGTLPKIIIYTDFECGACATFSSGVEPEIRELYVVTGKAQLEIRPLGTMSPDSMRAAQAALCAGDQGHFLEYQDALFRAWRVDGADAYSTDRLVVLATSLGLDGTAFRRCLESGAKEAEVEKNMDLARADDIHTLPAVVIGTSKVEGNKPLDVYVDAIDLALRTD
jgi:protein-disulfide isomerase